MITLHIIAGLIGILSGAIAMSVRKGAPLHRRSGALFTVSMLLMSASAVLIATFLRPNSGNVVAGTLTFYLVCTGALTLRQGVPQARALLVALMLVAVAVGAAGLALGQAALQRPNGAIDGIPAAPLFLFGVVALIGAGMDLRLLVVGSLSGAPRLARHLWRMSFAMWIASASLFLGQARHFPEPLRHYALLALPVLAVLLGMLYWLLRVWIRREAALRPVRLRPV